jgi:hypothetical protein
MKEPIGSLGGKGPCREGAEGRKRKSRGAEGIERRKKKGGREGERERACSSGP